MADNAADGRRVEGGPAQAVYIVNQTLPAGGGDSGVQRIEGVALGGEPDADLTIRPVLVAGLGAGSSLGALTLDSSNQLRISAVQLPTTLGAKTRANSLSVTQASDATGANAPQMIVNINGVVATAAADASALNARVPVVKHLYNGTTLDIERGVTTLKTTQGNVAAGADLTLWTPAVGRKFRLRNVRAHVSAAGRYELRDGTGTVIVYFYLSANTWVEIVNLQANGYLSTTANNALLLRNQTAGAVDMDAVASGSEE